MLARLPAFLFFFQNQKARPSINRHTIGIATPRPIFRPLLESFLSSEVVVEDGDDTSVAEVVLWLDVIADSGPVLIRNVAAVRSGP